MDSSSSEFSELSETTKLEQEMSSKTDNLMANLAQQITAKNKYVQELECNCNEMYLSLQKVMEESDLLHKQYYEVTEKESNIGRRSRELNEQVAQTDLKRRKLEEERNKNADQNDSLNMATIEQHKADERVLQLLEKHKKEKEDALNKILQLERQLDEKKKLELDIEQLKGKLEVGKHMEGEAFDVKKRYEETINDEIQDAKKELITGFSDLLGPHSNIRIKRMGELNEKPFVLFCKQRYGEDAELKAAALVCLWKDYLKDPNWYPFKIVATGSTTKQIINDKDDKLVGLKEQLGEEVYMAVTTALLEISEFNASGNHPVSELWNNKENRKASIAEAIQEILKQLKA